MGQSETLSSKQSIRWLLAAFLLLLVNETVWAGINRQTAAEDELVVGGEGEDVAGKDVTSSLLSSALATATLPARVKRSRDAQHQQLCGYRLLDALRNVCDRNFVGFVRRSDPSLFLRQGGDGASGEDLSIFGQDLGLMTPWEVMGLEYPSSSVIGFGEVVPSSTSTTTQSASSFGSGDDYWEGVMGMGMGIGASSGSGSGSNNGGSSPIWSQNLRTGGGGGTSTGVNSGTKAFALKMLAEPPKTHQRFRRNIIDECCKKPCAMGQMLKYCAIAAAGKRAII